MLISCPNCKTSFAVSAKSIGESGRKLKCSKCAHIWFQEPLNFNREKLDEFLNVAPPKIEENKNLPVKVKHHYNYTNLLILLFLGIFSYYLSIFKDFKINELTKFNSLEFRNFEAISELSDGKYKFTISGELYNNSPFEIPLSGLNAKVLSKGGNVVSSETINIPDKINARESLPIKVNLDKVIEKADLIEISLNNWLEKIFYSQEIKLD